jgi:hypothetical protein
VIVVVVLAWFTVWDTPVDVLVAKLLFPAYAAVKVREPAVLRVMLQLPAATVPVQVAVLALSETVTFPLGAPLLDVTVN